TVSSGGQPLTIDGKSQLTRAVLSAFTPDFIKPDSSLYYSDSRGIFRDLNSKSSKLSEITNAQQVAVSHDGAAMAYISAGLAFLGSTANPTSSTLISSAISSIDFDRYNRLWLINQSGQILVKSGAREPVSVSGQPANVLSVALAPDGVRLAAVQTSASGNILRIYSIVNTATGVSLTRAQRIETSFIDVTDIDWISDSELVVIGRLAGGEVRIYRLGFGGLPPIALGTVSDAVQVMAIQDEPIAVLTRQGLLVRYIDGMWKNFKTVNSATYAG
ncbi:MAG: Lipoprotein LpqB beta-propeller domain, partial [Actinomycetota bacterium]